MRIEISPSKASGKIMAPPSKSYGHRMLICAALADGVSTIENIGTNDDIVATIECLRELGAEITIKGTTATVIGISSKFEKKSVLELFCNESGSTLRFLIPLSSFFSKRTIFTGKKRLMERPQSVYEKLFVEKNCLLQKTENSLISCGELKSGEYKVRGDISSQFLTGLMFALPLLNGDSEIILTTELESAPYIDITIDVLNSFGVRIDKTETGYFIKGNQKYASCNAETEGDWSNSAFLDAFNLIGGSVELIGLNNDSCQGDKIYRAFFKELSSENPVFDISDCPDLGPVLITAAVLTHGATISGTNRLRIKESDRALVMQQELKKFGVNIFVGDDYITVPDVKAEKPCEAVDCHNDHRIAMAFSVLCSMTGGTLSGAQCVNKSYPGFFEDISKLGIEYNFIETE